MAVPSAADPWEDEQKDFAVRFRDADPAKRAAAVRALKEHRRPEGVEYLVDLFLKEANADVRAALEEVINGINEGAGRTRFYEMCRAGRTPDERAKLVAILGRGGFRDVLDQLKGLMKDREPLVRSAALGAARQSKWHSLEPAVRACLADAEPLVRLAAARCLGEFRLGESAASLVRAMEVETDDEVRAAHGEALGSISGQGFGTELQAWKNWLDGQAGLRVTQAQVDRALDKAGEWLVKRRPDGYTADFEELELELFAMIHAGIPRDHKNVVTAVDLIYRQPLSRVYRVALGAMALRDLDMRLHQPWLARAANFLVNNQAENGQWAYGEPIPGDTPSGAPAVSGGEGPSGGSKAIKRVPVRRNPKRKVGKTGDNSNTQYAVLGLRACAEAGVEIPRETWLECLSFLKVTQGKDGGWGYNSAPPSYGSIHTSAFGAYLVCRYYAGFGTKRDTETEKGIRWLDEKFAVDENPLRGAPKEWLFYYLYGMERVGAIADTEFFGKHEWYQEGAKFLLSQQHAEGHWDGDVRNTCWAILFLRRATRPVGKVEDK